MTWHTALQWFVGLSLGRQAAFVLLATAFVWVAWQALVDDEEEARRRRWFRQYRREHPK